MVKVITGIRRCGKSYLLFEIYREYLKSIGVDEDHIIALALDDDENIRYRNPLELGQYIRSLLVDKDKMYYVFLDEIQKVATIPNPYVPGGDEKVGFVDVLLGLMKIKNIDLYVTGSNSKMLSSDILTEFRGRGDEIRVNPLSYREFYDAHGEDKRHAWRDYFTYGGMPLVLLQRTSQDKSKYLHDLFDKIYLDDIMARHKISYDKYVLDDLLVRGGDSCTHPVCCFKIVAEFIRITILAILCLCSNILPQIPRFACTVFNPAQIRRCILISIAGSICTASICYKDQIILDQINCTRFSILLIYDLCSRFFTIIIFDDNIFDIHAILD